MILLANKKKRPHPGYEWMSRVLCLSLEFINLFNHSLLDIENLDVQDSKATLNYAKIGLHFLDMEPSSDNGSLEIMHPSSREINIHFHGGRDRKKTLNKNTSCQR